jgi:hypothetical protein
MVEEQGLRKAWDLRRTKLELPVVADDQMLHQHSQPGREIRNFTDFVCQDFQADHDVTEQLTFRAVREAALVRQLFDLADVMQNRARENKV